MVSTEPSAADLAVWQAALREQQAAEERLAAAVEAHDVSQMSELVRKLEVLRTVADLLLAQAVSRAPPAVHRVSLVDTRAPPAITGGG